MSYFYRLKAIAGVKDSPSGDLVSDAKPFICPHDGHFGDPDDCTKFYKCAHGTPIVEYCPATLFWNQGEEKNKKMKRALLCYTAAAMTEIIYSGNSK